MKKLIQLATVAAALASAGGAHALSFETVAGSPFTSQFLLTPNANNSAVVQVSGLLAQFSSLSFKILGGPTVNAVAANGSLVAAFSDPRNQTYQLNGATPYTVTITGTTKAQAPGVFGLASINVINGTVAAVPEPETYAMLLAGLGVLGAIARRRKQKGA